jgi:hypothetical protein
VWHLITPASIGALAATLSGPSSVPAGVTIPEPLAAYSSGTLTIVAINGSTSQLYNLPFYIVSSSIVPSGEIGSGGTGLFTVTQSGTNITITNTISGTNYFVTVRGGN